MKISLWVSLFILLTASVVLAEPTVKDVSLGEVLMGEKVNLADAEGQIVVLEFWGYN